jgi:hypothetical protein
MGKNYSYINVGPRPRTDNTVRLVRMNDCLRSNASRAAPEPVERKQLRRDVKGYKNVDNPNV